MAFPTSPTNGQTTTLNNITYIYNSTLGTWDVQGSSATASPVSSVAGRTGAVTLTAADIGAGTFPGAVTGTTINATTLNVSTITALATTITISSAVSFSGTQTLNSTQITSLGVGTAASGTTGEIRATNYITAFYSDARLKSEIGRIENALDRVDQLTGILYTQNELAESFGYNNYEVQVGLRAQDVQIAQPEAVKPAPFDIAEDGSSKSGENYLTVQYEKLVPLLVEAIKELRVELNMLKGQK